MSDFCEVESAGAEGDTELRFRSGGEIASCS